MQSTSMAVHTFTTSRIDNSWCCRWPRDKATRRLGAGFCGSVAARHAVREGWEPPDGLLVPSQSWQQLPSGRRCLLLLDLLVEAEVEELHGFPPIA